MIPERDVTGTKGRSEQTITQDRERTTTAGLEEYEAVKFALAGLIREADAAAWRAKRESLQKDLQSLLGRLAEDRFYLTLAGQFSRGKTTLMNAMLGMDRLPTGILPMTSVITAVSYNTSERVVLHFEGSNLSHEVSLAELPEWVTERGNPGNERKLEMAEVQLPAELLRRGAFFVDTPGLGSAILENTETTNRFLPHIDALVLVTSFEFPLSQEEIIFLKKTSSLGRKIFVAVNKLDLVSPGSRDEILMFIRGRIREETGSDEIPLFAVSSSEALAAKLAGDVCRLEQSGVAAFEQALINYLVTDRSNDFLSATCDRIESLLTSDSAPGLSELRGRLEEIRSRFRGGKRAALDLAGGAERFAVPPNAGRSVKISSCFVCQAMADATFRFLSHYQYDLGHHRAEQLAHASKAGFCTMHTREYARIASPQGIAAAYPNTLLLAAKRLRELVDDGQLMGGWNSAFAELVPEYEKCPACQAVSETETRIVDNFVRGLDPSLADGAKELPSACLRHIRMILQKIPEEFAVRFVVHAAVVLERTAENLERYALRHAGRHQEFVSMEERDAPEKALNLLVGQPNVRPDGGS